MGSRAIGRVAKIAVALKADLAAVDAGADREIVVVTEHLRSVKLALLVRSLRPNEMPSRGTGPGRVAYVG